ncbi:ABC transporter substrate-binding protein [Cellvibrio sp.]|uniref:ABC transporter substrate-binding protein n=1 Tax=Cellvibrio sp. TaxID=1965322 RepID=UPI003964819B
MNRFFWIRLGIIMIAVFSASCSKAPEPTVLRIGFNTWPGYEFIYLANAKGFYEAQGLRVKMVELNSLGDVRRAFERGQIDIMASTMVETIVAAESTRQPISLLAVTDASFGADVLLTRREGGLTALSDIKGKKVGMEAATVDVLVASAALKSIGLKLSDVDVVTGAQDDLVAKLEAGELDALETYPPYSIKLLATQKYKIIFDTTSIPGQIVDTLSVKKEFLQQHKAELDRFLEAYFQAFEYFAAHKEESAEIMGKREGVSGAAFIEATNEMQILGRLDQPAYFAGGKAEIALRSAIEALTLSQVISTPMSPSDFLSHSPSK